MARRIVWAESAVTALIEAAEYIAQDSVVYAAALVNGAEKAAESLVSFPLRGRVVPEFGDPELRDLFVGSYRLMFRVTDESSHRLLRSRRSKSC
ncbi:MAG: type II toxin-antitoxin system RelE/ParE family toxin [Acidobacteria bacterium]|nr:type II toxin-antitoxin system RelE/ParE family toxin [Acidobacteriota bacterium]